MKLPSVFERYRTHIDAELKSVLAERQSPLYDMMRYHLGWMDKNGNPLSNSSGKRLRPTLCLVSCEAVGGAYQRALPAAAAVELVHNYSLIHDDIQDDDRERRHAPTVWSIWGKPQAINAGTAMRLLASLSLERLREHGFPPQKQLRAQQLLDESSLILIEGQYLDISYESRLDIRIDDYLKMIDRKTAALIAGSMECGALLGTDDESLIEGLRDIGRSLGLAFQIRDDILGIWGKEEETGKPSGSDIRKKKKTLPIIYALENADQASKRELINLYKNGVTNEESIAAVAGILEAAGARLHAQKMVEKLGNGILSAIDALKLESAPRQDLKEMTRFLAERNF